MVLLLPPFITFYLLHRPLESDLPVSSPPQFTCRRVWKPFLQSFLWLQVAKCSSYLTLQQPYMQIIHSPPEPLRWPPQHHPSTLLPPFWLSCWLLFQLNFRYCGSLGLNLWFLPILLIFFHGWNFHLNANGFYIYIYSLDLSSELQTCILIHLPTQKFHTDTSSASEMQYVLDPHSCSSAPNLAFSNVSWLSKCDNICPIPHARRLGAIKDTSPRSHSQMVTKFYMYM